MGSIEAFASGFNIVDYHTETAATLITENIPGRDGKRLALIAFDYLALGTAHTLSIQVPGSLAGCRTTASAEAAAAQKVLNATTAPTDPAGNATATPDVIAYKVTGGSWEFNLVASLATNAITLTTNIAVIVPILAPIRIFGVVGDGAVQNIHCAASVVTSGAGNIYALSPFKGDPMYVSSNNATHDGAINRMLFAYINK